MSTLYIIATPIGNLEDVTHRSIRILGEIDALACEDTRRTRILLDRHCVPKPTVFFSYHEHNEQRATGRILTLLAEGLTVGLCTNAGTPCISDPGYRVVSAAVEAGHDVVPLPGPDAVAMALVASGLPSSSYTFKGFPPRKEGKRARFLRMECESPHTLVLFESPFRVGKLLASALAELGDRSAALCIELTKKFERVRRGSISELLSWAEATEIKGEVTVVIAGDHPKFRRDGSEPTP